MIDFSVGYKFKMDRDANGNKTVKISANAGGRGFSIQTDGNLPKTHRSNTPDIEEIISFVRRCGTDHQKEILQIKDATVEEMADEVEKWFNGASEQEKKIFRESTEKDLIRYHDNLGRTIRNHFGLWQRKWTPEVIDGVDCSENHPDAISMKVLKAVHDRVK